MCPFSVCSSKREWPFFPCISCLGHSVLLFSFLVGRFTGLLSKSPFPRSAGILSVSCYFAIVAVFRFLPIRLCYCLHMFWWLLSSDVVIVFAVCFVESNAPICSPSNIPQTWSADLICMFLSIVGYCALKSSLVCSAWGFQHDKLRDCDGYIFQRLLLRVCRGCEPK